MSKYNIQSSQIGSVGDNNHIYTVFHVKTGGGQPEIKQLLEELAQVKVKLAERETLRAEEAELQDVVEQLLLLKDEKTLLESIKQRASSIFHQYATGIGSGVLANYVFQFLQG